MTSFDRTVAQYCPLCFCRGPGVESAHREGERSPDTLLGPETSGPCDTAEPRALRPTGPPTHQWPARSDPHIDLLIVYASIFATSLPSHMGECVAIFSLSHRLCERRLVFCS